LCPETTSPLLQTLHPLRMFKIVFRGSSLIRNNCLYFVWYGWSVQALTAVATLAISVARIIPMHVARTSNNRVLPMEWSWWVTFNDAFEASEQLIVLTNGDDKSDLVISIIACCHSVKLCALAAQAFRPQQWHNAFTQVVSFLLHKAKPVLEIFCLHLNTIDWSGHVTSTLRRDNWLGFKS